MKLPLIYRKSMRSYFSALGIIILTIIGLQILGILIGLITGDGFSGITVSTMWHGVFDPFFGIADVLLAFYYLVVPYSEFKLGMQNGQTRWQIWVSQVCGVITITLLAWVFWLIATGFHYTSFASIVGMLLLIFDGTMFSYALGSGFALLPRMWKIIVGIAVPTILLILMVQVVKLLIDFWRPSTSTLNTLANIFNWQGSWFLIGFLWLAIMLSLSYLFTMHQQLRRD